MVCASPSISFHLEETVFDYRHYVPILKGKRAEFPALGALKSSKLITPLLEAVPSADADEIPRRMEAKAKWSTEKPYFIDFFFLDDEDDAATPASPKHPVRVCFDEVAKKKQIAIPVTGLSRSPGYQSAVQQVIAEQKHGVAVRLIPDDFEEGSDDLEATLNALMKLFKVKASDVDLIIDAGSVSGSSAGAVAQMYRASLDLLPHIKDWRTLTATASAFPIGLSQLVRDKWNVWNRHEWRGWKQLVTGKIPPSRKPAYGDYAIANPELPPSGRATILAQLRYAIAESWLIWKGGNVFKHPKKFDQFFDICKDLAKKSEYCGKDFSDGDAEIQQKAANHGSSGNAEKWRQIGTNHHIEMVLEQIANLP
jgi:hypothetical protein